MISKGTQMTSNILPDSVVKKATYLIRDSRQAVVAGLIPLLGLIFLLRLTQWYVMRKQYPALINGDKQHAQLSKDFREALPRLWLAVLLWPGVCLFVAGYMAVTR